MGQALTTESNTIQIPIPEEGETIRINSGDGKASYLRMPKKNVFGNDGYGILFQDSFVNISKSSATGEQLRVFIFLIGKMDFDNRILISQTDIAEELNINKGCVSRALKVLEELDVIRAYPKKVGGIKAYMLNPLISHKGAKNYKENKINYEKLKRRAN